MLRARGGQCVLQGGATFLHRQVLLLVDDSELALSIGLGSVEARPNDRLLVCLPAPLTASLTCSLTACVTACLTTCVTACVTACLIA